MADLPGADPSFTSMGCNGGVSPASMGLQSDTVLNDRYEVVRLIGQGGMGAVYEARDRIKDETIAIKVLLPGLVSSDQARERFLTEAKISCKLSHPNIVNVFDVQQSGPHHFLTMELLEGQTLREKIEVQKVARSEFSVDAVKDIAKQVGEALSYAHTHMVHRDLKPENIFLCEDGTVKVMDFGIVRLLTSTELTKTGMALGTAYYMAPEQLTGAKSVDARADQYSLGVILYELLSGQLPMGAVAPIGDIRKDIPKNMAQAIMKAISPKPEERFTQLAELSSSVGWGSSIDTTAHKPLVSRRGVAVTIALVSALAIAALLLPRFLQQENVTDPHISLPDAANDASSFSAPTCRTYPTKIARRVTEPVPVDEAFAITRMCYVASSVTVDFVIADGAYLYRDRIQVEPTKHNTLYGTPNFSQSEAHYDEFFGPVQIYRRTANVTIPLDGSRDDVKGGLQLRITFQGALDVGMTYPPTSKTLTIPGLF